jgi:hypothetical protein
LKWRENAEWIPTSPAENGDLTIGNASPKIEIKLSTKNLHTVDKQPTFNTRGGEYFDQFYSGNDYNFEVPKYGDGSDGIPYQPHSEIQWYRDKDGKLRSHATPGNGFLSAADPVSQAYLEGVALGPIANKLFRAGKGILKRGAEKLLPKTANKALASTATVPADVPFYDITSTEGKAAIDNTFARGMDTYADYLSSPWV